MATPVLGGVREDVVLHFDFSLCVRFQGVVRRVMESGIQNRNRIVVRDNKSIKSYQRRGRVENGGVKKQYT